MMNSLVCSVVVLVLMADLLNIPTRHPVNNRALDHPPGQASGKRAAPHRLRWSLLQTVDAKGVAGLGKAGGDSSAGSDKNGQQVPPEVYNALTYAGSAFLLTLSVPVILYTLNKLLNVIEDCFGCGPASRRASSEGRTRLADKRKKEMMVKDMKNLKAATATSQISHLLLDEKQKLFHDFNANLTHSLDNSSSTQPPTLNGGNQHLQNLLMSQPTSTGQQELLLNPLTVVAAAKDSKSLAAAGSARQSFGAPVAGLSGQKIHNFQQQFIIS